jgi:hypothetical protein
MTTHLDSLTRAADVADATEKYTCRRLRTRDGKPVTFLCEAIDGVTLARLLKRLPIAVPHAEPTEDDAPPESTDEDRELEFLEGPGVLLIEAGTALAGDDGSITRPAFWFGEPKPGAIDGRRMPLEDRSNAVMAILRLSGYVGGPADALDFPADTERGTDGGGVVGGDEAPATVGTGGAE